LGGAQPERPERARISGRARRRLPRGRTRRRSPAQEHGAFMTAPYRTPLCRCMPWRGSARRHRPFPMSCRSHRPRFTQAKRDLRLRARLPWRIRPRAAPPTAPMEHRAAYNRPRVPSGRPDHATAPPGVPRRRAKGRCCQTQTTASGRSWAAMVSCHQDIPRFILLLGVVLPWRLGAGQPSRGLNQCSRSRGTQDHRSTCSSSWDHLPSVPVPVPVPVAGTTSPGLDRDRLAQGWR